MIKVTIKSDKAKAKLLRLRLTSRADIIDAIVDRCAQETLTRLVRATPRGFFGAAKKAWTVVKPAPGIRVVTNPSKVMLFLEEGTKAHGPRGDLTGPLQPGRVTRKGKRTQINNQIAPRRRRALFIPLTKRAANATQGTFEVGPHNLKVSKTGVVKTVRALFQRTQSIRKGAVKTGERALIYGRDYVLAKRVRGITALHIVAKERPLARARLKLMLKAHIQEAMKG